MTYQLAVKYRPQSLDDVVGQDVVVKILKNAIKNDKLGSAIIFTGIRGTGKTSLARIIAKTINCETGGVVPCGVCASCINFGKNSNLDILEIDAASNTGVDDIRVVIDSCQYKPAMSKYKVYIIDEVHMLSKSAFNAVLKTLEEPPSHVKFIFATTEINKVPDTILSRCLRFDLKKIENQEMVSMLQHIITKENIDISVLALNIIAKKASGSMRDAISLLNLVVNLDQPITDTIVNEFLLNVDNVSLINLLSYLSNGDLEKSMQLLKGLYQKISSFKDFFVSLLEIIHAVMCLKLGIKSISGDIFSEEEHNLLVGIADKTSLFTLNNIWQIIMKGMNDINALPNQLVSVEMLIIRICYTASVPDVSYLIKNSIESFDTKYVLPKIEMTNIADMKNNTEKTNVVVNGKENKNQDIVINNFNDLLNIVERQDTILFGYVKSSCEFKKIDDKTIYLCETAIIPEDVKRKLSRILHGYSIVWTNFKEFSEDLKEKAKQLFVFSKEENI